MQNITIERYADWEAKNSETGRGFSACIYGQDDAGQGWILWLDETGRPCVYYGDREADGAVTGGQIDLIAS
jgi:hypothetical protein